MAREGIAALVCATVLFTPLISKLSAESEREIATALAVQQALKEGREAIAGHQYGTAVHILEQHLSKINGNKEYLACLRDAYRGYVKELHEAGPSRAEEKQTYLRRLEILDPGIHLDFPNAPAVAAPATPPVTPATPPAPDTTPARLDATSGPESEKPTGAVRGKFDEQPSPFDERNRRLEPASVLVRNAHEAYLKNDFLTARRLYEQAHIAEPASITGKQIDEWAYCKLVAVRERLRQGGDLPIDQLESEVKGAIALSPKLAPNGKQFLATIEAYRNGSSSAGLRHLDKSMNGWTVAESDYFRIFYKDNRELAEKVARVAEQVRRDMDHKWFGGDSQWKYRCDLYLHPTARDYSQATNKPENWTAHSTINLDGNQVTLRKIDLRADDPDLLTASLPHEATHAVLAGHFGSSQVPRWADEGMALLSEPSARLERYRAKLDEAERNGLVVRVRDLMTMNRYPERPAAQFAFYVQSVSVTDYLVKTGGAQAFTKFVNEGLKSGYDTALQKVYGLDMGTLEQRWRAETFGGSTQAAFRGADR